MAVPDYQSLMLPLLKTISDSKEDRFSEIKESIAQQFRLSDEDRKELLPSGRQARYENRIGWAKTYLKKAGLLENPERGIVRITSRGLEALNSNLSTIDNNFLKQYPEFIEFQNKSKQDNKQNENTVDPKQTPEEILESSYQSLRSELAQKILERLRKSSPSFFEKFVVDLLVTMGYGGSRRDAGQAVGQSSDNGIDGIIKEDKLGLDAVYIQAKRWTSTVVGRPDVQAFAGSWEGQRAKRGVMITTSV